MSSLPTTRWSLIKASGGGGEPARAAWSVLLQRYQRVIYAFFRRNSERADAEDQTQQFLTQSIANAWWARADADRGSFRTFLYTLLHRFQRDRLRAGSVELVSIDEDRIAGTDTAERELDLAFIAGLTDTALAALSETYRQRGRLDLFNVLKVGLAEPAAHGVWLERAKQLGMKPNSLTIERRRFAERLRAAMQQQLTDLCQDPEQAEQEWRWLCQLLRDV